MKKRPVLELILILIAALTLMLGNAVDWEKNLGTGSAEIAEIGSLQK